MKNSEFKKRAVRHGELLLIPVDELPTDAVEVFTGNEYILAHSETGHHHVAVGELTVFRPVGADSPDLFVKVHAPSRIEHRKTVEAHETKILRPGLYIARPKTEYDPFADVLAVVRD